MPLNMRRYAQLLAEQGLKHHLDAEEGVLRMLLVTRVYRNARGENVLILTVDAPDDGDRLRARIAFAFPPGDDPARLCLLLCRLTAETPLVAVEFDAEREDLALVAEMPVIDGSVTVRQLLALVNGLVAAAEECQIVIDAHPSMRSAAHRARRVG